MTLPNPFPAARYRFDCIAETPIRLPEYAGSTLRGVFGNALRRTACMTREKECKPCPLYRTCPYPAIFAPPPPAEHALQAFSEIPAPFVVEPPEWGARDYAAGDGFSFHFVLVGKALAQLPLIVYAWQRALQHGLGAGDGAARLVRVCLVAEEGSEHVVYLPEDGHLQPHAVGVPQFSGPSPTESVGLRIETPLRLQRNGRPLRPDELTARDLLVNLIRRVALLSEFHVDQPLGIDFHALAQAATGVRADGDLQWLDWTRYSSRQKQEMTLGGAVGSWRMTGKLEPFLPYLHLGQWLHCGKNASFGLGNYRLLPMTRTAVNWLYADRCGI